MEKIYRSGHGHAPIPGLAADNDVGRTVGRSHFARPIFYRQPRIGFKGRRFMLIKFRTMKVNAETHIHEAYLEHLIVSDRPMIKLDATGDPRLILGGSF